MRHFLHKHRELFVYFIAGVLTTIVYYMVRFTTHIFTDYSVACAATAQVVSIIFAFYINKYWVFRSKERRFKKVIVEMLKFALGRGAMFVFDLLMSFVFIELYGEEIINALQLQRLDYESAVFSIFDSFIGTSKLFYEFCIAIITSIIIVIVNYIFSKWIIFKKNNENEKGY